MNYLRFIKAPKWLAGMLCLLCWCFGCKSKATHYEPVYSKDTSTIKTLFFGVPSQSYYEVTSDFVNYLNKHLKGAQVQAVASSTFLGYNDKLDEGYFHLTIASGIKALESARNGYTIIAKAMDDRGNSGAILVHKDSSINSVQDLKGKTIATAGPPALPGHIMPMLFLSRRGLDVKKDFRIRYVESFESVYLNIYLGKCAAGFSTTTRWKSFIRQRPELASKLVLKFETDTVIGNALLIRNDIDINFKKQLESLILNMHNSEEGKKALGNIGFLRFEPADSNSYLPVKALLNEYEERAGPLKPVK